MNEQDKNRIARSLKKFSEEQHQRTRPPPIVVKHEKIGGSNPFQGKVDSGRYGAVGDKTQREDK